MKRSWIKLYLELLDDPKLLALSKDVKWDYVQLLLVAAEGDGSGALPDVRILALRIRGRERELLATLRVLQKAGVVTCQRGQWSVAKFQNRQAAMSDAQRSNRYRSRNRHEVSHDTVTEAVTKSDGDSHDAAVTSSPSVSPSPSVSVLEGGGAGEGAVFRCYEQNIGALTPVIADRLGMAIDDFGVDWVVSAVEYATGQEKRSLAYVEGVLRGWKRDGLTTVPKDGAKPLVSTEDVIRSVASAAS